MSLRCVLRDKPAGATVCLGLVSAWLPEDFERIPPLGFYFVVKTISWWFWFSLSCEPGESARRPLSPDFLCGHYPYSIQTTVKTTG